MSANDADFWKDSYAGAVAVGRAQRQTIGELVALLEEFLQFERQPAASNGELDHVRRAREAVAAQKTTTHNQE